MTDIEKLYCLTIRDAESPILASWMLKLESYVFIGPERGWKDVFSCGSMGDLVMSFRDCGEGYISLVFLSCSQVVR